MKCVIRISPIYFCLTSSLDDVIFGSLCVSGRIIVDQSLLHAEDSECLYGYKCKKPNKEAIIVMFQMDVIVNACIWTTTKIFCSNRNAEYLNNFKQV